MGRSSMRSMCYIYHAFSSRFCTHEHDASHAHVLGASSSTCCAMTALMVAGCRGSCGGRLICKWSTLLSARPRYHQACQLKHDPKRRVPGMCALFDIFLVHHVTSRDCSHRFPFLCYKGWTASWERKCAWASTGLRHQALPLNATTLHITYWLLQPPAHQRRVQPQLHSAMQNELLSTFSLVPPGCRLHRRPTGPSGGSYCC